MQRGSAMQQQKPDHPKPVCNLLKSVFETGTGRKICLDTKGLTVVSNGRTRNDSRVPTQLNCLQKKQKLDHWCVHQSAALASCGRCIFAGCPGLKKSKAKRQRAPKTYMRCVEYSVLQGKDIFLCNKTKQGVPQLCHWMYHSKHFSKKALASGAVSAATTAPPRAGVITPP